MASPIWNRNLFNFYPLIRPASTKNVRTPGPSVWGRLNELGVGGGRGRGGRVWPKKQNKLVVKYMYHDQRRDWSAWASSTYYDNFVRAITIGRLWIFLSQLVHYNCRRNLAITILVTLDSLQCSRGIHLQASSWQQVIPCSRERLTIYLW